MHTKWLQASWTNQNHYCIKFNSLTESFCVTCSGLLPHPYMVKKKLHLRASKETLRSFLLRTIELSNYNNQWVHLVPSARDVCKIADLHFLNNFMPSFTQPFCFLHSHQKTPCSALSWLDRGMFLSKFQLTDLFSNQFFSVNSRTFLVENNKRSSGDLQTLVFLASIHVLRLFITKIPISFLI